MDLVTIIAQGAGLFVIVGLMIIRPYLHYRDVVSGAIKYDSNDNFIIQGCISGGISIYLSVGIGFEDTFIRIAILSFALLSLTQFYFSVKAWLWNKNNK